MVRNSRPDGTLPGGNLRLARLFGSYRAKAKEYVRDPAKLEELASSARSKAGNSPSSRIRELGDQIKLLGRLIRAYARGEYRDIPLGSIVMVVAGVLYFVTPIDLIPDAMPGAGLLDDATILAFVLARLDHELVRFRAWETSRAIDVPSH